MSVSQYKKIVYEFGQFRLDVQERLLLREGEAVSLIPIAFDLLVVLVESRGHLLEKDDLMRRVWPDSFVEEGNLAQNISLIRKALGESETSKFIETVPRRGYRFVASVRAVRDGGANLVLLDQVRSPLTNEREEEERGDAEKRRRGEPLHLPVNTRVQIPAWTFKLLAVLVLFAVSAAVAFYWIWSKPKPPVPAGAMKTIAVLPFKPLSADGRDEMLGLGIADTLINKLSGIRRIIVRPLSVVSRYQDLDIDSVTAGRQLRVDYVLEGSLQMIGEKTRANVRLLDVKDGRAVWTHTCDEHCSNVIELQDTIALRTARALVIELTGEETKRLARHHTESTEAYEAYMWGRHFLQKRTRQDTEKSIRYFEQAIKLDPDYAPAYAILAETHLSLAKLKARLPEEVMPRAKAGAEKALAIDDTLAEAHAVLGSIAFYEWDWSGAEREFTRAIDLNPNYERNSSDYEHCLLATKRFDEALAESRRVLEFDPTSAHYNRNVAMILYLTRRFDEAIEHCKKTLELDPNMESVYAWLAAASEQKGLHDQAVAAYLKTGAFAGLGPEAGLAAREAYATLGWRGFWRKALELAKEQPKHWYANTSWLAEIYARLGEKDRAFGLLENAFEQRLTRLKFLNTDPIWDSLRPDPRYRDLVGRMGLEP